MKKTFPLKQVLSVVGDRLLCDVDGIYEILNFLTQDNLFTHQLPRACQECRPWLLRWFPEFTTYDDSSVTPNNWRGFLDEQVEKYGPSRDIEPIPRDDHETKDPILEAWEMKGADRVVSIRLPDDTRQKDSD